MISDDCHQVYQAFIKSASVITIVIDQPFIHQDNPSSQARSLVAPAPSAASLAALADSIVAPWRLGRDHQWSPLGFQQWSMVDFNG